MKVAENGVKQNVYGMHPLLLHFLSPEVEAGYRSHTLSAVLTFTRATWLLVMVLAVVFSILDKYFFAGHTGLVFTMRFGLILSAAFMFVIPHHLKSRHLMDRQGFAFILILGFFCNTLVFLDTTTTGFSLWFASLFFVFPGVFITPGMGFRYSIIAMLLTPVFFNLLYFLYTPFQIHDFLFYNIFLGGMVVVYIFMAYLVESSIRKNYVTMSRLRDSKEKIQQLNGLLPICSHCKNIRDDQGYWRRVETYIQDNTGATFSHGMCPSCMDEMYGDKKWYQKMKLKKAKADNI